MFGLFGKKKKEAPDPEPVQEETAAGGESGEYRAFAEDFEPEVLDILALTGPLGFWEEKQEGDELWTLTANLTAWMEVEEPVHQGSFRLVTKGDDALRDYLQSHVPGDFVLKFKARLEKDGGDRLLMTSLPEPGYDPELKALREEQRKPVTFWLEGLGTFTLVRAAGWFETDAEWLGDTVQLTMDQDLDREGCAETAKALLSDAEGWDARVRSFAAEQLPDLELEEDGALVLESIGAAPEGVFEFWFSSGEGPSVCITGNLADGPMEARTEG